MKVYIILEDFGCEGYDEPVMVFDSLEKADAYVLENIKDLYNPMVFEREVK
jgi:hypothetical protein